MLQYLRFISDNGVLVGGDVHDIESFLNLRPSESVLSKIPHDQMVNGSAANKLLSFSHKGVGKGFGVLANLNGIFLEFRGVDLFQLNSECSNGNIMWSTLEHWEDSEVNGVSVFGLLEDNT